MVKLPGLTEAETKAIDVIGRHRKTKVKVGVNKPISTRMFNQLKRKGLVMWLSEAQHTVMLTARGETFWTRLHPTSKYRIK